MKKSVVSCLLALIVFTGLLPQAFAESGKQSVFFGRYEQDLKENNGPEQIEWLVLDVQEDKLLLLSKYILDNAAFKNGGESSNWENSDIRAWLNGDFLQSAFTGEEQKAIALSRLDNSRYTRGVDCGPDTEDKVFFLSEREADKYFDFNSHRAAVVTAASGVKTEYEDQAWWWLRTMGAASTKVEGVHAEGGINHNGRTSGDLRGVRPALWLDLNAVKSGECGAEMMLWLAELYRQGIAVPMDAQEADFWTEKAAALVEKEAPVPMFEYVPQVTIRSSDAFFMSMKEFSARQIEKRFAIRIGYKPFFGDGHNHSYLCFEEAVKDLVAFAIPVRLACKCENCLQSEWIAVFDGGKGEKWSAVKGLRFNENGEAIVSFSSAEAFDLCSFACLPVDSGNAVHGNEVQVKLGEMYFGFSTYDAAESFARRLR